VIENSFMSLVQDDQPMPKVITFDDEDAGGGQLPPSQQKMQVGNPEKVKRGIIIAVFMINLLQTNVALQFLAEYFKIYDSDSRQSLLDAYHEEACMSYSAHYPGQSTKDAQSGQSAQSRGLKDYFPESRNLLRATDPYRRQKLLKRGKLAVVSLLNDLPKTQHDEASFTLDVHFAVDTMITLTLSGVFKERSATASGGSPTIRHFSRMFVLMASPAGGWNIVNEVMHVTNPTVAQCRVRKLCLKAFLTVQFSVLLPHRLRRRARLNQLWQRPTPDRTRPRRAT